MRNLNGLLLGALFFQAGAAYAITTDEVVARYVDARGGAEKFSALDPALDPGWSPRRPRGSELTDSQFDQPIVGAEADQSAARGDGGTLKGAGVCGRRLRSAVRGE